MKKFISLVIYKFKPAIETKIEPIATHRTTAAE